MNANVGITGDVGVAVNAEQGASVHVYVAQGAPENMTNPVNRNGVYRLCYG